MFKDSQSEFTKLIGKIILNKSLNEAKKARYYSIVSDATSDSNHQKML